MDRSQFETNLGVLKFVKITVLLNMHSPNLTLFNTKDRSSLAEILFGIGNYPALEQENAVHFPLHS